MNIKEFIKKMNDETIHYKTTSRKERASLLTWFLINFYRIDEDTAIDLVCDSDNDKGIDGIYIDDQTEEVYIFQSKFSPNPENPQGDNDLRNFKGARAWFDSQDNIQTLDNSSASQELKSLVSRLEVFDKLARGYKLFMVFVTNKRFNVEANDYLKVLGDEIEAWDIDRLFDQYTYTGKDKPVDDNFAFTIDETNKISIKLDPLSTEVNSSSTSEENSVEVIIFTAKAKELVQLKGIQDRTLFARNVRYGLGRTRVNKDITKTLKKVSEHANFFLYHNGITLVCSSFEIKNEPETGIRKLFVTNYSIVNGCQSTLSFYENKKFLTDDIKILMRVIQIGDKDKLSQDITYYTNNQNAISLKDLKSNDKIQQDLQDEFKTLFNNEILYKIKNGENVIGYKLIIENDFAAQLITSFYLKEPFTTHQKTQIFTDNYNNIFSRHINAYNIFIIEEIYRAIDKNCNLIEDEGIRTYKLTRFLFVYIFRLIFEDDSAGQEFIHEPSAFYSKYKAVFFQAFEKIFRLIVLDFNYYVNAEMGNGYFDYKNALRNANKVQTIAGEILLAYKKQLVHHPEDSFEQIIKTK